MASPPPALDARLFELVNRDLGPAADAATRLLSDRWFGVAWGVLLVALALRRGGADRLRLALSAPAAVGLADLAGAELWKPLFGRTRPCYALPEGTFRWVVPAADSGAMPSLHAANFAAMAVVAWAIDRRLGVLAALLAAAVALARVHGGVHWPSDVAVGAAWGALCGAAVRAAGARMAARLRA